jgi:hypothetical protein
MTKQIWMGHPGHFIGGFNCQFRLNTYINGYIVSTVGEYCPSPDKKNQPLGYPKDSLYETMVFKAKKSDHPCCPYVQEDGQDLDSERYATADKAHEGHMKMLAKWSEK